MQTPDRIFNPCPPFEKARERLLQLALRNVPMSYSGYERLASLVRTSVEDAFRAEDEKDYLTYDNLLRVKLVIGFIDRAYIEECHGQLMLNTLRHYERINGECLMDLPCIGAFAKESSRQHYLLRNALGIVALTWNLLCHGTFAMTPAPGRTASDTQHPDRV